MGPTAGGDGCHAKQPSERVLTSGVIPQCENGGMRIPAAWWRGKLHQVLDPELPLEDLEYPVQVGTKPDFPEGGFLTRRSVLVWLTKAAWGMFPLPIRRPILGIEMGALGLLVPLLSSVTHLSIGYMDLVAVLLATLSIGCAMWALVVVARTWNAHDRRIQWIEEGQEATSRLGG